MSGARGRADVPGKAGCRPYRNGLRLAARLAICAGAIGAVVAFAATPPARAVPPVQVDSPASSGGGLCYVANLVWVCVYQGHSPGGPGSVHSAKYICTFSTAPASILERVGEGPPAPGNQWDIMRCPGLTNGPIGGVLVQVSTATGRPAISPEQLLKIAVGDLRVPVLAPLTAPPSDRYGLVGLPEWFWIPRSEWKKITITVTAGPVWATAVAAPVSLMYSPGGGLPGVSCPGPGTPFQAGVPVGQQRTDCSYTYDLPSADQPGDVYQAAVTVGWRISWTGSGHSGGVLTGDFPVSFPLHIQIGQAEALVIAP